MYALEFFNNLKPEMTGSVILLSAEDDLKDTITPRLLAAGAPNNQKIPMIHVPVTKADGSLLSLADPIDRLKLEMMIEQHGVRLIIIDPLNAYLGEKVDSHNDQKIRQVLSPLSELANRTGAAIVALRHLSKGGGPKAIYRGMGSIGYTAAARVNFFVSESPDLDGSFILAVSKVNITEKPPSLRYRIEAVEVEGIKEPVPRIKWLGESHLSANDLAVASSDEKAGKLEEAEEFLMGELADGPVTKGEIEKKSHQQGIKPITLRRAKEKLKVKHYQEGRMFYWTKPEGVDWTSTPF